MRRTIKAFSGAHHLLPVAKFRLFRLLASFISMNSGISASPSLFYASLTISLFSGLVLTTLAIDGSDSAYAVLAMFIALVFIASLLIIERIHHLQLKKTDRYQRLGRRLTQLKRAKKRDEAMAISLLNHIVRQSDTPSHINIWQQPRENFSGDLALASHHENGTSYTLLADLTGHGIAAAMGATPVASIFQATARRALSIEKIFIELNERLTQLLPPEYFCCASLITCHDGHVKICNAGLPALRIVTCEGRVIETIASNQLPLGIDSINEEDVVVFSKYFTESSWLYTFTDGLTEATDSNGREFGESGIETLISSSSPPYGRIALIKSGFSEFVKGSNPDDDISIVEVKIC